MTVDLLLRPDLIIRKDVFVQSSVVSNDFLHISPNISKVSEASGVRAILGNDRSREFERIVYLAGWKRRERSLVPETNVDDGVGQVNLLNMVQDDFFLWICQTCGDSDI